MAILPVGIGPQEGGYQIERSLRFNSADSAYLNRTFTTPTSSQKFTWSGWIKRSKLDSSGLQGIFAPYASGTVYGYLAWYQDGIRIFDRLSGGTNYLLQTTAVYRDVSSWYHIVYAVDTTQATSANRVRLYVNGTEVTTFSSSTYPTQNNTTTTNSAISHRIGYDESNTGYFDGYLTEVNFIDGQALDPTSFGEYNSDTGVWQPKAYTGSYGTNGFYLDFADNSSTTALGYDAAGSNDWTPNNFSVTAGAGNDSLVDTPTPYGTDTGAGGEVRGNYATANPLKKSSTATLTNGNLDVAHSSAGGEQPANFAVSSGKWYWEATPNSAYAAYGIILTSATPSASSIASGYHYYAGNGQFYTGTSGISYGATFTSGDVIGVALDLDTNQITFYKNGTSQGAKSISAGEYYPDFAAASTNTTNCNFGQRPFAYTAPSGFKALCTQNLPEPTVVDGSQYFDATTYTGNGTAGRVITVSDIDNVGLAWVKIRSGADDHRIANVVTGGNKHLKSNATDAESTGTNIIQAFSGNTFTVGSDLGVNSSGSTYVAWTWAANGTGVSNTAGTITSTVSANTTAGFSIVTYTGTGSAATIGHGLGVAPAMVMTKSRSNNTGDGFITYHKSLPSASYWLDLATTGAQSGPNSVVWNGTAPTSTVFSVGSATGTNTNTYTYVAYCFAPIAGYSAFGSYTGNGSDDGPFVYTGFRPRYLMWKNATTAGNGWIIWDTARNPYNLSKTILAADQSIADYDATSVSPGFPCDILSNGFKLRGSRDTGNNSGATFIYAAFAENPFKYSLAR